MLENGDERRTFRVKDWGDLASIGAVLLMAVAGLAWGLKLEARVDGLNSIVSERGARIAKLEAVVSSGALAVGEERDREQSKAIDQLRAELAAHVGADRILFEHFARDRRDR
jgi:hypothetical protein